MPDKLIEQFYEKAEKMDFNVTGLLLSGLNVLTLGSDSKCSDWKEILLILHMILYIFYF